MQVTHSNFAYNHHETDFVDTKNGVMPYPYFKVKEGQINIYPDMPYGEYSISYGKIKNNLKNFSSGKYISHKIADYQDFNISLGKVNSHLPSRIPIGFSGKSFQALPEILLTRLFGNLHQSKTQKRFWWGPIGNNKTKLLGNRITR